MSTNESTRQWESINSDYNDLLQPSINAPKKKRKRKRKRKVIQPNLDLPIEIDLLPDLIDNPSKLKNMVFFDLSFDDILLTLVSIK